MLRVQLLITCLLFSLYSFTQNYDLYIGSLNTAGDTYDIAVSGSYAYVADGYYARIVDISDVSNPTEVGSYEVADYAQGVFISGNYLYVADSNAGLLILDVTDKTNPTLVDSLDYMKPGTQDWQNNYQNVIVSGNYAYVTAYKYFYIFDVSDPSNITHHGTYTCGNCYNFDLDGNYIYIAGGSGGLKIVDVSDPSNPTQVALHDDYTDGCCVGIDDVVISGNYAYATRYDHATGNNHHRLYIYDVSNPTSPSLLYYPDYSLNYDDTHSPDAIAIDGTYVYSSLWGVIQVHDVSNVNSPVLHALIEPNGNTVQIDVSGDYIFLSNRSSGFQIIDTRLLKTVSRWTNSGGDNLWSNSSNWANNTLPTSSDDVTILSGSSVTIDASASAANVSIVSGGTMNIDSSGKLFVNNDFSNAGTVTINSSSSNFGAILTSASSEASGLITYNRWVNSVGTDEWDLIGSPFDGLSISSFASTNSSPLATGGGSGGNQYAIGYYDNSADDWTNYTTATIGSAGNFDIGKGYQMATDSGATLAFTGYISTSNQTQAVQDHSGASGRIWNLVANPYPTYLYANSNANSNNFITYNAITNNNLHDSYAAIYGWDADGSGYTIYNNTSGATYIAPGQGFMVASDDSGGTTVALNQNMRTLSGSDDFISGDVMENTEVVVKLFNGDNELESTKLFFDEGLTLGLDPGYDAGHFDDNAPIMTRLVEEDEGYGMAINAMGLDAMENAVIPLVINQSAGQEFRINLFTATIPDPNVYLEDVEEGTFTNLYEEDFVYTPTSDLEGVGRFFIHMTADTMSSGEVSTSMLNAYKEIDASYITIEGLATQTNETKVSLYNILGREVLSTTLNNNMGTQTISTVGLSAGIYVIELESGSDRLTKKLLIQ